MVKEGLIVAIDGPAGAGKSTVARRVAQALNYLYLDTGAMYRAVALKALQTKVDPEDEEALARLARETEISLAARDDRVVVLMDGRDVSDQIRDPAVGAIVARIAGFPDVRRELSRKQRELALRGSTVLEGRDTGSHVVPEAHVKIFLTADPEERVRRRHRELQARGYGTDMETVSQEIAQRDLLDTTRAVAPLVQAPGAHVIDSTHLSIDEVVDRIIDLCRTAQTNHTS